MSNKNKTSNGTAITASLPGNGNGKMTDEQHVNSGDGQEYIPDYFASEEVLKNVYNDVKRGKINLRYFVSRTGYQKSTLSLVFNGKYTGRTNDIVEKIKRAAIEYYSRGDLVKTRAFIELRALCKAAWENFDINACFGHAGIGKTEALKHYYQENPDHAVYICIWASDRPGEVLDKIADELDIQFGRMSVSKRIRRICEVLRMRPRLLIFDEADQAKKNILNMLRQISDEGNCGMVFCGNLKLKLIMTRSEDAMDSLAYLFRRIRTVLRLDSMSYGDAKEILAGQEDLDLTESCIKQLIKQVKNNGEIDRFRKIIDAAREQAEYNKIDVINDDVVMRAASTMLWG